MTGSLDFDRRFVLAAGVAVPLLAVGDVPARASTPVGRPDLMIDEDGEGAWRWRSWRHDGRSWRPVRGDARVAGAGIVVRGAVPAADRAALIDALKQAAPGRAIRLSADG